jgi:hypothetical protein
MYFFVLAFSVLSVIGPGWIHADVSMMKECLFSKNRRR